MIRTRPTSLRTVTALVLAALACPAAAGPIDAAWTARWREDLEFVRERIPAVHADAFHALPEADFHRALDTLADRLPELEHHEAVVELARIVAALGDGHSRLTLPLAAGVEFEQGHSSTPPPALDELVFHQLPVRFAVDATGPYVTALDARHRGLLGARLRAIDGRPAAAVRAALEPTVRRDNSMQILHHLPMHLALGELLHGAGVTAAPDRARIELETPDGELRVLELHTLPAGVPVSWARLGEDPGRPPPLTLRHPERWYWFSRLEESRTVYVKLDRIENSDDESLAAFTERLRRHLSEGRVERLILDLRHNRGGDNSRYAPLLRALICSELNRTGRLFTIVGRATFSAAMSLALDLEQHTETLFVGEPTGARPNHYGDSRKLRLPNTGLTLRISTLYWQHHPRDARPWILPELPVAVTRDDVAAGRDPVLERILSLARSGRSGEELAGRWRGRLKRPGLDVGLEIELAAGADGWSARVTAPELGLDSTAAGAVSVAGPAVDLTLPLQDRPLTLRGTARGDTLIGDAAWSGYPLHFVLEPAP